MLVGWCHQPTNNISTSDLILFLTLHRDPLLRLTVLVIRCHKAVKEDRWETSTSTDEHHACYSTGSIEDYSSPLGTESPTSIVRRTSGYQSGSDFFYFVALCTSVHNYIYVVLFYKKQNIFQPIPKLGLNCSDFEEYQTCDMNLKHHYRLLMQLWSTAFSLSGNPTLSGRHAPKFCTSTIVALPPRNNPFDVEDELCLTPCYLPFIHISVLNYRVALRSRYLKFSLH